MLDVCRWLAPALPAQDCLLQWQADRCGVVTACLVFVREVCFTAGAASAGVGQHAATMARLTRFLTRYYILNLLVAST